MRDLDTAIRAKLADRPALEASELPGERARDVNGWLSAARAAIEAVLDRHKAEWNGGKQICWCCREGGPGYEAEPVAWPCPTVLDIATALGIEADRD